MFQTAKKGRYRKFSERLAKKLARADAAGRSWLGPDCRAYFRYCLKLLKVLSLYALATAILLSGYLWLLRSTGECLTCRQLADLSRGRPLLWHSGYFNSGCRRPQVAAELGPQVAVFGSSRVMQLRDKMFSRTSEKGFYIAGTSGNFSLPCLLALQRVVQATEKPELALVGLDFWWFLTKDPPERQTQAKLLRWIDPHSYRQLRAARYQVREWNDFILDQGQLLQCAWRDGRFQQTLQADDPVEPHSGRSLWGVNARLTGNGYRNDGSYRYTTSLKRYAQTGEMQGGLKKQIRPSAWAGNYLAEAALDDVKEMIDECRKNHVRLIVFLPPVAERELAVLRASPESAEFWRQFPKKIQEICEAQDVPFHDFTDVSRLVAPAGNFFDWYHPSEKLMGRLLLEMCRDSQSEKTLSLYVDQERLEREVQAAGNAYLIYGD